MSLPKGASKLCLCPEHLKNKEMNIVDFSAKTNNNKEKHLVARVKDAVIQYSFFQQSCFEVLLYARYQI